MTRQNWILAQPKKDVRWNTVLAYVMKLQRKVFPLSTKSDLPIYFCYAQETFARIWLPSSRLSTGRKKKNDGNKFSKFLHTTRTRTLFLQTTTPPSLLSAHYFSFTVVWTCTNKLFKLSFKGVSYFVRSSSSHLAFCTLHNHSHNFLPAIRHKSQQI